LALLLVNDLYFKAQFGNWFTGKLSDFAGLVAFALFWSAVFPRHTKLVHVAIGVGFVLWKLPLADPMLTLWNSSAPLDFARVTDLTDLMALGMLPLSFYHFRQLGMRGSGIAISGQVALLKTTAVCTVSLLAFVATTADHSVDFDDEGVDPTKYTFDAPRDQVVDAAYSLFRVSERPSEGWYWIKYKGSVCSASTTARITFSDIAESEHAELQILDVDPGECENLVEECVVYKNYSWLNRTADEDKALPSRDCLRQEFQELVIHPLQAYLASQPTPDAPK
jgi:hypothetical protein